MSKSGRRISGFFKAMLLAVLSFFVVFLFFPDVSESLFGVSLRGNPELVDQVTRKAGDIAGSVVDTAVDTAKDLAKDATDVAVDAVSNTVSGIVDGIKDGVN